MKTEKINKTRMKRIALPILLNALSILLIVLIMNINVLVAPQNNLHTRESTVKFEWIGLSNAKIDDNPQFTSPVEIVKNNPVIELKPGTYYWKAGLSGTRIFVIESEVSVAVIPKIVGNETTYKIENQGNTRILLNIIGLITGKVVLEPKAVTYQENVSNIKEIEASQNG